ncbi:response regulator transcription factor [Streptomyces sp. SID13031]|uniref:response regulator transcription factor n=1 Tax=Streptomyces sp. SID13031 TaxID=2706046 RepID=UPI0013C9A563|nr:response regulator transcription factor [Streptomyces sp. SID13031]NEA33621.1 response regulator transcription factor [Streptomyces sp. SID13031]
MLRILLAEDVAMVRGAMVALIELEPDLKVVAAVKSGADVVSTARSCRPDVAVLNVDLPVMDGLSAAAELRTEMPYCRTLILTNLGRSGTVSRAYAARVSGFMLKDSPPEDLATTIRNIARGRRVIDPQLAVSAWDSGQYPLSTREHEVLRLTAGGADPVEIASDLHLSVGTVRNYLTKIVTKLQARNRVDAVKMAYDSGWLP